MVRKDKEKTLEYNRNYMKIRYKKMKELLKQSREQSTEEQMNESTEQQTEDEEFISQMETVNNKLKERIKTILIRYGDNEYRVNKEYYNNNQLKVLKRIKEMDTDDDNDTSYY